MNINRIIKEEINKFILSEAIDFNNLRNYSNQLNKCVGNIRNINSNRFSNDLKKFFNDLTIYGVQIIAAINRCMQANNLNEASWGSLSSYGINLPGVLGGNMWQDAKQGYYGTKNFLQRGRGYNNLYGNSNGNANGQRINPNTVPSVKLSELLKKLTQWQTEYRNKNSQYNIDSFTQEPYNMLARIIPSIQNEYNAQMQNAQGHP